MGKTTVIVLVAILAYIVWNLIVFAMYGIDKRKAQRGQWRISENMLIFSAIFMGGLGAMMGMKKFRHKTKHLKFKLLIPFSIVLNVLFVGLIIYLVWIK